MPTGEAHLMAWQDRHVVAVLRVLDQVLDDEECSIEVPARDVGPVRQVRDMLRIEATADDARAEGQKGGDGS